jgi:alpha-beta hydrolase superfamily lysophospholipase
MNTSINLLCIRGLIRDQRHWWSFPNTLQKDFPAIRFFAIDPPGVGSQYQRQSPQTIAEIRHDLRERWLRLKDENPGPWALLGISLGGMISLDWVDHHPSDFTHAIIINSSAKDLGNTTERFNLKFYPKILKTICYPTMEAREKLILEMTSNHYEEHATQLPQLIEWQQSAPASRQTFYQQLRAAMKYRSPNQIIIPSLVISSTQDQLVSSNCSFRLAEKLKATHVSHPTAGHDISLDEPEWLSTVIGNYLLKN